MELIDFLQVFIDESKEHLQACNEHLIKLEKDPENIAVINEIFRSVHTLKGMAATMEYGDLTNLTHQLENLLDAIRDGRIGVTKAVLDGLFFGVDELDLILQSIITGGNGTRNISDALQRLMELEKNPERTEQKKENGYQYSPNTEPHSIHEIVYDPLEITIIQQAMEQGSRVFEIMITLAQDCLLKAARVALIFHTLEKLGEIIKSVPSFDQLEEEQFDLTFTITFSTQSTSESIYQQLINISEVENAELNSLPIINPNWNQERLDGIVKNPQEVGSLEPFATFTAIPAINKTIRVQIERLDTLMNLFQEFVIHRGRLEQISRELDHPELRESVDGMAVLSSQMQSVLLNMRMLPISTVFNRFPRMIRQLARELNKQISIEIIGAETELERSVVDEIGDSLIHILRNCVDHGIEYPDIRKTLGKPTEGKITLKAFHSGNHVFIEVSDDGGGINREKVIQSAITKGLLAENDEQGLSDQEVYDLLFMSGFSTSSEISNISGRGVGLDVAKYTIESLGGTLTINSQLGRGTVFLIKLPLTLSIQSVLLTKIQSEIYAIPISFIIETVIKKQEEVMSIEGQKSISFRDKTIPLVYLQELLEVPGGAYEEDSLKIVMVQIGNKTIAFVVDSFIGHQEVVLKPLGNYLPPIRGISGAAVLGDGQLALIVDCHTLI